MTTFIGGMNLWTMGHMTQGWINPMIAPLTNAKNEVPLELMDLCFITPIYKQFQRVSFICRYSACVWKFIEIVLLNFVSTEILSKFSDMIEFDIR